MLSGEGNAGERWKIAIGLISKTATLHLQHTVFVHFFAVFLHDYGGTSRNFLVKLLMEEMSYVFSFTVFHCHSFSPCIWLVAASISYFVTSATKFQQKNVSFFLSHDLDLCRPISRWASQACRLLPLYLCVSLAVYSKFVDVTVNLSLIF